MKKHLKFSLVLSLLASTLVSAKSETILISDIDDTIKVSHVLDLDSVAANAPAIRNSFMGMSKLYRLLLEEKKADKFIYLSNAPARLMRKMHQRFIKINDFPEGTLLLSQGISNKDHKINSIRKVIEDENPSELILIGDNGERDPEVYAQVRNEYPDLKITTYIHQVYSQIGYHRNFGRLLEKDQIGFATSIDLAVQLGSKGYISKKSYTDLVKTIVPKALKESPFNERGLPMMFPAWLDCRDYQPVSLPEISDENGEDLVKNFETRLAERCSRVPYMN